MRVSRTRVCGGAFSESGREYPAAPSRSLIHTNLPPNKAAVQVLLCVTLWLRLVLLSFRRKMVVGGVESDIRPNREAGVVGAETKPRRLPPDRDYYPTRDNRRVPKTP